MFPMEKKILHLTLKKKWFNLIVSGEKTVEYREFKPYWEKRLLDAFGNIKKFEEIYFKNGYARDAPFMRVELGTIQIMPVNGIKCFCIILGKILELSPDSSNRLKPVESSGHKL